MPAYPFQRAKPLGWSVNEKVTSAQLNQIDQNAAQGADGLVWTDVAAFRNFGSPQTLSNSGFSAVYMSTVKTWALMGVSATLPLLYQLYGASGQFVVMPATTNGTALTPRKRAADFNPTSGIALFGGLPGASSNKKYVRNFAGNIILGASMNAPIQSSQTNTGAVNCLKWVPAIGLWVAGLDSVSNGIVETSPDGITFTARAVPNIDSRVAIATGPAGTVISADVLTTKVIHSTNGINWFERTLPGATEIWKNVVYVPLLNKYIALNNGITRIAYSTDAVNWFDQPITVGANLTGLSATDSHVVAFGRTMFATPRITAAGPTLGIYSQDGGANWSIASTFPGSNTGYLGVSDSQLLYGDGTAVYLSMGGGF